MLDIAFVYPNSHRAESAELCAPGAEIISSKIYGWGGARPNSGGPRANSGGARPNTGGARPGAGRPRKEPIPRSELPEPEIRGERWYCFESFSGMAFVAEEELALAGFETVLPRERVEVIRHKARKEIREIAVRPLFGRYGFVKLDMGGIWMPAAYALGVKRLIGRSSERPTPVPVGAIEKFLEHMDDAGIYAGHGVVPIRLALPPIKHGSLVQMLEGPLTDRIGICDLSVRDRVYVLLDIMGAQRRVRMERSAVQPIEGVK